MLSGKCLLDDNENLCFDTATKSNTWKDHHNCLLNQVCLESKKFVYCPSGCWSCSFCDWRATV